MHERLLGEDFRGVCLAEVRECVRRQTSGGPCSTVRVPELLELAQSMSGKAAALFAYGAAGVAPDVKVAALEPGQPFARAVSQPRGPVDRLVQHLRLTVEVTHR